MVIITIITTEAPLKVSLSGGDKGKNRGYNADGDQCVTKVVHILPLLKSHLNRPNIRLKSV